jgi:SAM-dependent methyltransferase
MRHERKSSETNKQAADYWRALWRDRCVNITSGEILASLIKANGFDSGCGDYTVSQWKTMSETLCASLNISRSSCVLEVGCGSGALLYAIQLCSQAKVFGYD